MFIPKENPRRAGSGEEEPPDGRKAAPIRHRTKGRQEEMSNLSLFSSSVSCQCLHGQARSGEGLGDQSAKIGFQGTEQGKKRVENTSRGQRIRCTMSLSKVGKLNH